MATAVGLAAECAMPRLVLDEGPAAVDLLTRLMAKRGHGGAPGDFLAALLGAATSRASAGDDGLLSSRELDVLRLMAEGMSNKSIAERLFVSVGTVKRHSHNIYQKLGASRRTEALVKAREAGVL
jgi:LuxR family maltose regulon positive regulatory protein